jgi:hypothetical protein
VGVEGEAGSARKGEDRLAFTLLSLEMGKCPKVVAANAMEE